MIRNWQPSGALQAGHLQCQPEAIAETYVEHWLQLRVVKATGRDREKKESPTQWLWLTKTPRYNILIFWFSLQNCRHIKASEEGYRGSSEKETGRAGEVGGASCQGVDKNFKTPMSKTAKILARKRRQSWRRTTGPERTKEPAFETVRIR